jgi:hypothetical protein
MLVMAMMICRCVNGKVNRRVDNDSHQGSIAGMVESGQMKLKQSEANEICFASAYSDLRKRERFYLLILVSTYMCAHEDILRLL